MVCDNFRLKPDLVSDIAEDLAGSAKAADAVGRHRPAGPRPPGPPPPPSTPPPSPLCVGPGPVRSAATPQETARATPPACPGRPTPPTTRRPPRPRVRPHRKRAPASCQRPDPALIVRADDDVHEPAALDRERGLAHRPSPDVEPVERGGDLVALALRWRDPSVPILALDASAGAASSLRHLSF